MRILLLPKPRLRRAARDHGCRGRPGGAVATRAPSAGGEDLASSGGRARAGARNRAGHGVEHRCRGELTGAHAGVGVDADRPRGPRRGRATGAGRGVGIGLRLHPGLPDRAGPSARGRGRGAARLRPRPQQLGLRRRLWRRRGGGVRPRLSAGGEPLRWPAHQPADPRRGDAVRAPGARALRRRPAGARLLRRRRHRSPGRGAVAGRSIRSPDLDAARRAARPPADVRRTPASAELALLASQEGVPVDARVETGATRARACIRIAASGSPVDVDIDPGIPLTGVPYASPDESTPAPARELALTGITAAPARGPTCRLPS